MVDIDEKLKKLLLRNTFFIKALPKDEQKYQRDILSIVEALKRLRQKVKKQHLLEAVADFLQKEEHGLNAVLTLSGLSSEKLYRIISFLRLSYQQGLYQSDSEWFKKWRIKGEWKEEKIKKNLKKDRSFAEDLAKIFLGRNKFVMDALSPYERGMLNEDKFLFKNEALLDTLARYSFHGSYSEIKGDAPEAIVKKVLDELRVIYEGGSGLKDVVGRDMDIVIPSKTKPKVFIQILFGETTSSEMGDKARAERDTVAKSIKEKFPEAFLVLFVDGAGWLARVSDLKIMLEATPYVFTFHEECIKEFKELLKQKLPKKCYKQNLTKFFTSS